MSPLAESPDAFVNILHISGKGWLVKDVSSYKLVKSSFWQHHNRCGFEFWWEPPAGPSPTPPGFVHMWYLWITWSEKDLQKGLLEFLFLDDVSLLLKYANIITMIWSLEYKFKAYYLFQHTRFLSSDPFFSPCYTSNIKVDISLWI